MGTEKGCRNKKNLVCWIYVIVGVLGILNGVRIIVKVINTKREVARMLNETSSLDWKIGADGPTSTFVATGADIYFLNIPLWVWFTGISLCISVISFFLLYRSLIKHRIT
jgi:hypothetical protein